MLSSASIRPNAARAVDDGLRRLRPREVGVDHQGLGPRRSHRRGGLLQLVAAPRDEHQRPEIAREPDGGGLPDSLARSVTMAVDFGHGMSPEKARG